MNKEKDCSVYACCLMGPLLLCVCLIILHQIIIFLKLILFFGEHEHIRPVYKGQSLII